jgi:hypothetical protein
VTCVFYRSVPKSYIEDIRRYSSVDNSDQEISVVAEKPRVVLSSRRLEAKTSGRTRRNIVIHSLSSRSSMCEVL